MTEKEIEIQKAMWMESMIEQTEEGHKLQNSSVYCIINVILIIIIMPLFAYGISLL